jgi:hypothetical protein
LQSAELRAGLDIFHIPPPVYKDLAAVEAQAELLERCWGVVREWESAYNGWKDGRFRDIQVGELGPWAEREPQNSSLSF